MWYRLVTAPLDFHLIMMVNLIFHEAGHVLTLPFGAFIHALGGTLGELGVPLICAVTFWQQRAYGGLLFTCWWLATALFSVGTYASDARSQTLPLITGDPATHDWTFILGELQLLPYDTLIGGLFHFLSYIALVAAGTAAYHLIQRQYRPHP